MLNIWKGKETKLKEGNTVVEDSIEGIPLEATKSPQGWAKNLLSTFEINGNVERLESRQENNLEMKWLTFATHFIYGVKKKCQSGSFGWNLG